MIGMGAASRSAQTAAWRCGRTTAARVALASWSIVSFVMPGPAPCLVRVVLPINPSQPASVPASVGDCG